VLPRWKPDIPRAEQVEVAFSRDVFDAAVQALHPVFFLRLPEEKMDAVAPVVGGADEQLQEIVLGCE
jgi:hypothetical protein